VVRLLAHSSVVLSTVIYRRWAVFGKRTFSVQYFNTGYSPSFLVGMFKEVRLYGVLRRSLSNSSEQPIGTLSIPSGRVAKSLFGKVHTPLASRFSIRRIMATSMKLSLLCPFRS
jgi:hypothetical protein